MYILQIVRDSDNQTSTVNILKESISTTVIELSPLCENALFCKQEVQAIKLMRFS